MRVTHLIGHTEVLHLQSLVVVPQGHLQQLRAPALAPGVQRQTVVVLRQLLLLDAHGVHIVPCLAADQNPATATQALTAAATAGRVPLLLEDHLLRWEVLHHGLGGQAGECGHRRQVAEHDHARAKAGVHAAVGA